MTTSAVVKFDGGARPNLGPAAIGYIVEGDDWTEEGHDHIGDSTNNQAEYHALFRGLEVAFEKGCTEIAAEYRISDRIAIQKRYVVPYFYSQYGE